MLKSSRKPKHQRLWDACSYGYEAVVRDLISDGVNVNWRSPVYGCCPLHVASQGKTSILKLLIDSGVQIDAVDLEENTALHHAAMSGNVDNVLMLLQGGADVNALNKNSWTPLFNSVYWNHSEITQLLLEAGADPFLKNKQGRIPLHELCRSKSKDSKSLLANIKLLFKYMNSSRNCSLVSEQIISDNAEIVSNDNVPPLRLSHPLSTFIDLRTCSSNESDSETDFTPFLYACYHGHLEIVRILIDQGVDVAVRDKNHWTALHWAAHRCHADIVEVLLDNGISPLAKDRRGNMPYSVTSDIGLQECLMPDKVDCYPTIISNGDVTTDDDDVDVDGDGIGEIREDKEIARLNRKCVN